MHYAKGIGYFVGIIIIILGIYWSASSNTTVGAYAGIIAIILGIIIIWQVRKIGRNK